MTAGIPLGDGLLIGTITTTQESTGPAIVRYAACSRTRAGSDAVEPHELTPAEIVRQSAAMARRSAETARLHKEPEEAARFEQLAAEGEARADQLDALRLRLAAEETERQAVAEHDVAVRTLEHP
jgi:hypothetical protein